MNEYKLGRCPVCNNDKSKEIGSKVGLKLAKEFKIMHCIMCDCVYVDNPLPPMMVKEIYNEDYFSSKGLDTESGYTQALAKQSAMFTKYDKTMGYELAQYPFVDNPKWLDVGCALGNVIEWVEKRYKANVFGVEVSEYAKQVAISRGHTILANTIENVPTSYNGFFDVVTAYEVLEHLYNPQSFIKNVSRLLRKGGLFHYSTNIPPSEKEILNWHYLRPEVHIVFYSPRCMKYLLELGGLKPHRRRIDTSMKWRTYLKLRHPSNLLRNMYQPDGIKE